MAKRIGGNTSTLNESAFSGMVIKINECDDSQVMVQRFYPKDGETYYTKPVLKDLDFLYNEDTADYEAGFKIYDKNYFTNEFMRDDYMVGVN